MTITYPLTLPSAPAIRTIQMRSIDVAAQTISPFTGESEIQEWDGQWWEADVGLPPMRREFAEAWVTMLAKLNGIRGTLLIGDPDASTPRGNPVGSPVVNGNSQTGQSLAVRGWTASAAGVLLEGDYIQIGTGAAARLHKVLSDVDADASGLASLDIWPRLRVSPADGTPLVTSSAVGLFRLAGNTRGWSTDAASIYGISFAVREAI